MKLLIPVLLLLSVIGCEPKVDMDCINEIVWQRREIYIKDSIIRELTREDITVVPEVPPVNPCGKCDKELAMRYADSCQRYSIIGSAPNVSRHRKEQAKKAYEYYQKLCWREMDNCPNDGVEPYPPISAENQRIYPLKP